MTQVNEVEMTVDEFLAHYGTVAEEALAHYGVLGMKWGKRKAEGDSGSGTGTKMAPGKMSRNLTAEAVAKATAKSKKSTTAEIMDARRNTELRVAKIFEADAKYRLATTEKGKQAALAEVQKWGKTINEHPDSYIAAKKTTGEKVALGLLAVGGAMSLASIVSGARPKNYGGPGISSMLG